MFLYARPWSVICPVCHSVMLNTQKPNVVKCVEPKCRLAGRTYLIDLPLIKATEVSHDPLPGSN